MNSCNSITRTTKELSEQWGGKCEHTLNKKKYTNGKYAYGNVFNIITHLGNAK